MFSMRRAEPGDRASVEDVIRTRCEWMERKGLPSWRDSAADLASQCDNPFGDVWLLELDGRVVGRTTVQEQGPPWGWTPQERAEPALYLNTSVTDPSVRHLRPGALMALWAVNRAAREGRDWVRRDCLWPDLVRYYESQGFTLLHEVERTKYRLYMLGRPRGAARRPGRMVQDRNAVAARCRSSGSTRPDSMSGEPPVSVFAEAE
ncbi:GNAT family N-acetyltransferase [Streptomyces netropsis]|uniref:GNAT family N-acetyltransferase n=1 Tax=Streptomyces netropsis TaxID=55404 RepID=UPI0037B6B811